MESAAPQYPYLEEVNDGILRQFDRLPAGFIPSGQVGRVLDVGCGRAALGQAIRAKGWEVWGVEQASEACATARERINRLVQADLGDFASVEAELGEQLFDILVFSDVLEHVPDPLNVLRWYLRRVRPGGRVLVSVPNFAVWTNRLRVLCGNVDTTDTGVMDRTHLRLFSFRVARKLVKEAGCAVERSDSTPHLVRAFLPVIKWLLLSRKKGTADPRAMIDSPAYRFYQRWLYPAERFAGGLWPALLAFRIIVVGVKPAAVDAFGEGL